MKNLGQMMQKAQEAQQRLAEMKSRLAQAEIAGSSGGGMVQIVFNGNGEAKKVALDPKVIDPADPGMLQDLIAVAINDGRSKIDAHIESETQKIMGGMMMPPGMKLPF